MSKELFDAYDINGNKLNIDMERGKQHKKGLYHFVVEIYTINEKNEILLTKRHPNKHFPLYWEVSGGSVLKGETILQGAVRELQEETGIKVNESDLQLIYKDIRNDSLYRGFIVFVNSQEQQIILQDQETIDYQWLPIIELEDFINNELFVDTLKVRFLNNKKTIYQYIEKKTN